jgi:hypothetical protein
MQNTKTRFYGWFWTGEEPEWIVVMTVLIALLLGSLLMLAATGETTDASIEKLSFKYPARWSAVDDKTAGMAGGQDLATNTSVTVAVFRKLDPAKPVLMDDLVTMRSFDQGQKLSLYRVLSTGVVQVVGKNATMLTFAYVTDPAKSAYQTTLPRVMRGVDYLIVHQGQVYLVSLEGEANLWQPGLIDAIVQSVRFN